MPSNDPSNDPSNEPINDPSRDPSNDPFDDNFDDLFNNLFSVLKGIKVEPKSIDDLLSLLDLLEDTTPELGMIKDCLIHLKEGNPELKSIEDLISLLRKEDDAELDSSSSLSKEEEHPELESRLHSLQADIAEGRLDESPILKRLALPTSLNMAQLEDYYKKEQKLFKDMERFFEMQEKDDGKP